MYCKHCGTKLDAGKACPKCGKKSGGEGLKIALMVITGILVVAVMVGIVYVTQNGWPDFGGDTDTSLDGTTPTGTGRDDVTNKGTYTVSDEALLAAKDTVVATMGDATLTNGQLQVYYWMNVGDFLNYYGSYVTYFGLDTTKPFDQQIYDEESGQSWQHFFLEGALESWQRDQALTLEAEKNGYTMAKDYQDYLDNLYEALEEAAAEGEYESVEAMLQADMGVAADYDTYKYYMDRYYKGNLYYEEAYKKLDVTVEELEAYYEENAEALESEYGVTKDSGTVAGMEYVMFFPEGATSDTVMTDTFDQAAWDAAKDKAQSLMNSWVAGGATEEAFAALITEHASSENTGGTAAALSGLSQYFSVEVDVRHVLLQPADDTEEDWETCRKKAQALLDSWVAGGATEEAFAAMAKEYTADSNGDQGGLYEDVYKDEMVAEFDAWIFDASRKYGDYDLVKTEYGYHIMFFVHADVEIDNWVFTEGRQAGEYAVLKSDYGYYVVRFTGMEEAWAYYSRENIQLDKMDQLITDNYVLDTDYSAIVLGTASAFG